MENTKINKKDLKKVSINWLYGSQMAWNYEKMMAPGYLYSILPALQKLYKGEELKEMMDVHNQFFNTTPHMGGFILGIDLATEEKEGSKSKAAVSSIKTGLMGSFAGVGDTIFGVLFPTVFGSVASYMALSGNAIGVLIWILVNIGILIFRYFSVFIGYKQGAKLVGAMSGRLSALTDAATLLGITVIGALIPSVVRANVTWKFKSGEVTLPLQETLDQIMPMLIPVMVVGFVYYLLGTKHFNSTRAILLIVILGIMLSALNILG